MTIQIRTTHVPTIQVLKNNILNTIPQKGIKIKKKTGM